MAEYTRPTALKVRVFWCWFFLPFIILTESLEYMLPVDEYELDRMDMQHHKYTLLQGDKLYLAPLRDDPQKILDIGTGGHQVPDRYRFSDTRHQEPASGPSRWPRNSTRPRSVLRPTKPHLTRGRESRR